MLARVLAVLLFLSYINYCEEDKVSPGTYLVNISIAKT